MGATESAKPTLRGVLPDSDRLTSLKSGLVFFIKSNETRYELAVPDISLTCGWLLSEVIRKDDSVVALRTVDNNEAQDYWLTQYERPLLPFSDQQIFETIQRRPVSQTVNRSHFMIVKMIGRGGFSLVFLVRKINSGELFAMKCINKAFIKREGKVVQAITEKRVMERASHPFIVSLKWAFQSVRRIQDHELHLVMDFCPGGELFFHLHNLGRFTETQAKFYFGEIVLGLRHLHSLNIVYRDLKPENILLDLDGHVKLTDFGLAKEDMDKSALSNSYCGSPEYMSPEMLMRTGHGRSVDLYSLGALLFEMLVGLPPFYCKNRSKMFARIKKEPLVVPHFVSEKARSLLTGLLAKEPRLRLGAQTGLDEVMLHPWCSKIKWGKLLNKKILPPFRPNIKLSNFDPECTSTPVTDLEDQGQVDMDFEGFSYDFETSKIDSTKSSESQVQSFYTKNQLTNEALAVDINQRQEIFSSLKSPETSYPNSGDISPSPLTPKCNRKGGELDLLNSTFSPSNLHEEVKYPRYRNASPKPPRGGRFKQIRIQQLEPDS